MSITKEEVAEAVRRYVARFNSGDMKAVVGMDAGCVTLSWRGAAWRDLRAISEDVYLKALQRLREQFEYRRMDLEELNTSVESDIGLAWGIGTEFFKMKGRPEEHARVRFSLVLKKSAAGWKVLLDHRDAQPFDKEGRWVPLTGIWQNK